MSYEDDIPEPFRRLFEEIERNQGPPDDDGPMHPRRPEVGWPPFWRSHWFWLGIGLLALLLSFNSLVTFYTEWLWFESVDYVSVWLKQWLARWGTFAGAFVMAALFLGLNLWLASRGALRTSNPRSFQPARYAGFNWLLRGGTILAALFLASAAAARWEDWLLYAYRMAGDKIDPVFNRSLGFYFFELPIYHFLQGWFVSLAIITLLGVAAVYILHNLEAIRLNRWQPIAILPLRRHVALLGAFLALLLAVGYLLARYDLLQRRGSPTVFGAGYVDLTVNVRAYLVNTLLLVALAGALVANVWRLWLRPVAILAGLWLASVILVSGLVSNLAQNYVVAPNELNLEQTYLAHNIDFTRFAFGLDTIEVRDFGEATPLSAADLTENELALQNLRIWDYRVLPQNYEQLQALRPYYQFGDVDSDRYLIDGQLRQVNLAARELNKDQLPNDSWVNRKLEFTHGYGIVMSPIDRFTPDGQPEFFIRDLPPVAEVDIALTRPEIYFGERTADVVFVNSAREEFSYPSGAQNVRTRYAGSGGVEVRHFFRRLALAIRFGEINLLLSRDITPTTQALYHREIVERVQRITPFLVFDLDPYLVVHEGRLVWMVDAFTISDRVPYSEDLTATFQDGTHRLNYIRNAAKVVVDAYEGSVTYYLVDASDPLTQAYARAFPDLFQPLDAMPESLRAHIRYPETLFHIQTHQYLKYHMIDVGVFYNQEDLWAIPQEVFAQGETRATEPYYVIFSLPDEPETEYLLIAPFTPAGKNNMVAWIAARNDPEHYGQLLAYVLPKQELVFGPIQVEGRIDQEPTISQQISLWNQGGSRVIRGNLIVIPLNRSFLYVEPLYLLSEASALPELKRVILASDTRIAMEETLNEALQALLGDSIGVPDLPGQPAGETSASPAPVVEAAVENLIQSANQHLEAAQAAQRVGDWATYGAELDALEAALQQLLALTQDGE